MDEISQEQNQPYYNIQNKSIKVKLVIAEIAKGELQKTIRKMLSPILTKFDQQQQFGMFHSAVVVGMDLKHINQIFNFQDVLSLLYSSCFIFALKAIQNTLIKYKKHKLNPPKKKNFFQNPKDHGTLSGTTAAFAFQENAIPEPP